MVTGSQDHTAKVWETMNWTERMVLGGQPEYVKAMSFSQNRHWIVTESASDTAKVWAASTGRELLALTNLTGGVLAVAISPDDKWIATGSEEPTATLWPACHAQRSPRLDSFGSFFPG
jgi:WD40 repeat protein